MTVNDLLTLWQGVMPDIGGALQTLFYLAGAAALIDVAKRTVL